MQVQHPSKDSFSGLQVATLDGLPRFMGPAGALQANLHRLGWSVDSLGMFEY